MNLTRALTLTHGAKERKLIAVGRVQTPTLALVAERDRTIKNFKAVPYFVIKAEVSGGRGSFTALWKPSDQQEGLDSEGRLVNLSLIHIFQRSPFVLRRLKFLEFQIFTLLGIKNDKRTGNEAFYRFVLIFFVLFH